MVLCMARPTRRSGSGNHQLRKRVPADVLAKARGQRVRLRLPVAGEGEPILVSVTIGAEISLSLRTADKGLAKQRHAAVLAQLDEHFDRLRAGPKPLSQKEQVAIAGILYRAFAEGLEDNPGTPELWERVREMNEYAISGGTRSLVIYNSEAERQAAALEDRFGPMVDIVLANEGIVTDTASRAGVMAAAARALTEAAEKLKRNAEGDYRPDPVAVRFPPWAGTAAVQNANGALPALTFDTLFERWQRETRPAASTVTTWRGHLRMLKEHLGHNDPRRVTRADMVAWKDKLIDRGLSPNSIRDSHLASIKTLFNYAVNNGLLTENPVRGVRVAGRVSAGERRLPYTDDEVASLLALASGETHPARRWLPWLLALSGARVGELAQLWGKRIVEIDGIHVMRIAPAEDGGSLKNANSERDVPLHPALVEQGFLAFVRSRGDGPLFYGTQGAPRPLRRGSGADTHRHASKGVSNRLASWIRSEGFTDSRKAPSHAFRHWFKTTCARLGIQERVADAIQGHVGNQTAADTYVHIDVAMKADAIGRIPVPQVKAGSGPLSSRLANY